MASAIFYRRIKKIIFLDSTLALDLGAFAGLAVNIQASADGLGALAR